MISKQIYVGWHNLLCETYIHIALFCNQFFFFLRVSLALYKDTK